MSVKMTHPSSKIPTIPEANTIYNYYEKLLNGEIPVRWLYNFRIVARVICEQLKS